MQIKRWENNPADSLLLLLTEEDCNNIPSFDEDIREIVSVLVSRKDFNGKKGSTLRVPMVEGTMYLVGLGKKEKSCLNIIRDFLVQGLRNAGKNHCRSVYVPLSHLKEHDGLCFTLLQKNFGREFSL